MPSRLKPAGSKQHLSSMLDTNFSSSFEAAISFLKMEKVNRVTKGIPLGERQGGNNRPFQEFLPYQKIVALTQTKNFERPSINIVHSMYKYFFVQLYILRLTLLCRFFDRDQTLLSLV